MNRVKKTRYNSVGELLDILPVPELEIVELLRGFIFECIPECEEKLAYNVPFYYRYSRICYVWPASIPRGGVDEGVAIGFCKGHLLPDEINYLERGNRKHVYTKTYVAPDQIEVDLLKSYLFEAAAIDARSQ